MKNWSTIVGFLLDHPDDPKSAKKLLAWFQEKYHARPTRDGRLYWLIKDLERDQWCVPIAPLPPWVPVPQMLPACERERAIAWIKQDLWYGGVCPRRYVFSPLLSSVSKVHIIDYPEVFDGVYFPLKDQPENDEDWVLPAHE